MSSENEVREALDYLIVEGARVHNLKNISVKIPHNKLVVITGLSGSGKSSLAFDTIYAEGQRRFIESFQSYARQFLGTLERPDVDAIEGLSPVISIEQKTVSKNPRSTVGTITEIYDFLRLLYAKAADAYSYVTGEKMVKFNEAEILSLIKKQYSGKRLTLLAPLVRSRKGHYRELFQQILKQGFVKVRVDGEIMDIVPGMQLDRYKIHNIEVVIDRLVVDEKNEDRLKKSVDLALRKGKGVFMVLPYQSDEVKYFSRNLMCPTSGIAYDDPAPNNFSFNSPVGSCPKCSGLGEVSEVNVKKIIPHNSLSIKKGGIAPLGSYKNSWIFKQIELLGKHYGFTLDTPIKDLPERALSTILYGNAEPIYVEEKIAGVISTHTLNFEGIVNIILRQYEENPSKSIMRWAHSFMNKIPCPECNGARLKKESLYFKIDNKNIAEVANMEISDLQQWVKSLPGKLSESKNIIAAEIIKELNSRIEFLMQVGLSYLTLNRSAGTLSGGEAQRIRLATQIGAQLVNVLYILDEPSIGLHARDNERLIKSLKNLRDIGNSVIVVEHDKDIMLESDEIIDIGPKAGVHGGELVAQGNPEEFLKQNSETAKYLSGKLKIDIPEKRREGNGKFIELTGASGNNLKNISVKIPLGKFVAVTGVSGSGKSTLINATLYPILSNHIYPNSSKKPMPYKKIKGLEHIDKVINIDQSPIGRMPRSNPATYTGVFTEIRALFAQLPEAKIRGYKPGRFSFNVKGGRCETCKGAGVKVIEMNFLPDVYVTCDECMGKRYNRETLEVRYKGKSISDVLEMTIADALPFFENIPAIRKTLEALNDVGLGYVKLGQPSTTLSGGEAQRVKLASELAKKQTGKTFYILDEPTTGLHFEDIRILLTVLNRLVDAGNTVLVIEHNLDIVKVADWVVDLGPDGGKQGGEIVAESTPEEIIKNKNSLTAKYLKNELKN